MTPLTLSLNALDEYLKLWALLEDIHLHEDVHDQQISFRSIIKQLILQCFFVGRIRFAPGSITMQIFHQVCHTCYCWIMNGLAKRGLPCPATCPCCDQASKTINLLTSCVVARDVWFTVFQRIGSTTWCHCLVLLVEPGNKDHQKWSNTLIKTPQWLCCQQCYPERQVRTADNRRDGPYGAQLGLRASGAPF